MFDREGGEVGVGHEVAPQLVVPDEGTKHIPMAVGRSGNPGGARTQPVVEVTPGFVRTQRSCSRPRVGADSDEGSQALL
jgi:hypothetical protein